MPHLRFAGSTYWFHPARWDEILTTVHEGLKKGGVFRLELPDKDGDMNVLFVTPGAAVAVSEWDTYEPSEDPTLMEGLDFPQPPHLNFGI